MFALANFDPRLSVVKSVFDCRLSGVVRKRHGNTNKGTDIQMEITIKTFSNQHSLPRLDNCKKNKKGHKHLTYIPKSGLEVIKHFFMFNSTHLSMKFIILINVKMQTITIVGILTFIIIINTA